MTSHPEVMAMVREQLERPSPPGTAALYGRAVRIDPSIRKVTLRQFNARYPLQVRRQKAAERGSRPALQGRPPETVVAGIRRVLLRLARDIAVAEGAPGVIDVLAGLDRYVAEAVAFGRHARD